MYLGKKRKDTAYTEGLRKLLEVKDSDIRMVTFRQGQVPSKKESIWEEPLQQLFHW